MKDLNNNQIIFCQKYVDNGSNGTKAYIEAYPKCKSEDIAKASASRLLTNANVKEYISELQEELEKKAIMTAEERMKWLSEVVNDIQREECNVKTLDGEEIKIGQKNADLNTKMKAIDILNKMTGKYVTKIEGEIKVNKLEDLL